MTVQELIEKLGEFPPDHLVVYEGEYTPIHVEYLKEVTGWVFLG